MEKATEHQIHLSLLLITDVFRFGNLTQDSAHGQLILVTSQHTTLPHICPAGWQHQRQTPVLATVRVPALSLCQLEIPGENSSSLGVRCHSPQKAEGRAQVCL